MNILNTFNQLNLKISQLINSRQMQSIFSQAEIHNKWFIPKFSQFAIQNIQQEFLSEPALNYIKENYFLPKAFHPQSIGILAAGNIPFACFLDLFCVLISGHKACLKLSQRDKILPIWFIQLLIELDPSLDSKIEIVDQLKNCKAYLVSGSNQTINALKPFLQSKPHILRNHRTSMAVLTGKESPKQLTALGQDVFTYFGLGCRNITQLFIPNGFDLDKLTDYWRDYHFLIDYNHYKQNIDYQLSLALLNHEKFLFKDFILFKFMSNLNPPIGVVHCYEYQNEREIIDFIANHNQTIQCVVGNNYLPFGISQNPKFIDFPDRKDPLSFLLNL